MKKISLCIIVLMVFGVMLFAQESDASAVVGYVGYNCVPGTLGHNNNLIALPLHSEWENASDLGNDYPHIDAVYHWDIEEQVWYSAHLDDGEWINDFALRTGHAYMISLSDIEEEFTIFNVGMLGDEIQYNLTLGDEGRNNNLLMVPLMRSNLNTASALGNNIGVANSVYLWNPHYQIWDFSYKNVDNEWIDNFDIQTATPLMVNITEEVIWPGGGRRMMDESRRRSGTDRESR